MFDFCIYEIKKPDGTKEKGYFFGIWGVINSFADTSEVSNEEFLEMDRRLNRGAAVNYRGRVIRKYKISF